MDARTQNYELLLRALDRGEPPSPAFWIPPVDRGQAMHRAITLVSLRLELVGSALGAETDLAPDDLAHLRNRLGPLCDAVAARIMSGRSVSEALEQWQVLLARSWNFKHSPAALEEAASLHDAASALPTQLRDLPSARPFVANPKLDNPRSWSALNSIRKGALLAIPAAIQEVLEPKRGVKGPQSLDEVLQLLVIYTASDVEHWEAIVRRRDRLRH